MKRPRLGRRNDPSSEPPVANPDWPVGPPDFVGIGAQRAGTTRWFRLIAQHPGVSGDYDAERSAGKELHYYDKLWIANSATPADYHRLFPRAPGTLVGEWTPRYLYDPHVPELLARDAPDARLLVILRDPIERLLSGLAWEDRMSDAFARGFYAQQLRRWFRWFRRDRMLILQHERCVSDAAEELDRTFRFLGLEPAPVEGLNDRVGFWRDQTKPELAPEFRRAVTDAYRADIDELREICPDFDFSLWPTAAR